MELEIVDTYKLLDSESDDETQSQTWSLCKSEEEFLKKYTSAIDDEKTLLTKKEENIRERYAKEIAELTGSLSAEDLLCKEEIEEIEGLRLPKEKYMIVNTDMEAYYKMKNAWIQYFTPELYKGYYKGNMALARCQVCAFVTDAWPCKEKRHYHVPEEFCGFCEKRLRLQNDGERKLYTEMKPRRHWNYYKCNQ